jgi:hypothetical protein
MAAELLSFFRSAMSVSGDWSSQEIAEFYRVEAALVQAGVSVFGDRGLSDEGDPWFVFCRATDGEVIVHFARINGNYLIVAEPLARPIRGPDFRKVLADFVAINPTLIPIPSSRTARITLHPASLLAAIVATALYHMSGTEAVASALDPAAVDRSHWLDHHASSIDTPVETSADPHRKWSDWQVAAVVSAMIALAAAEYSDHGKEILLDLASTILDTSNDHIVLSHSVAADAAPVLNSNDLTAGGLESQDAHTIFDSFILSGGGEAANQQFQLNSNDGLAQKVPSTPTVSTQDSSEGGHWWTALIHGGNSDPQYSVWTETSSGLSSDPTVKGADQFAAAIVVPSGQGSSQGSSVSGGDPGHPNPTVGSSSAPDATNLQLASAIVNNDLSAANKVVPQTSLTGSLSVQDVINHGASDVLGAVLPSSLSVANHDSGQLATTTAVTPSGSTAADNSAVLSTASVHTQLATTYQPFDAAANQAINAFVAQNNFEVLTANNNVVLFDTNAADFSSHNPNLVERTWSMPDGSTISIVGILSHNYVAVA